MESRKHQKRISRSISGLETKEAAEAALKDLQEWLMFTTWENKLGFITETEHGWKAEVQANCG